MRLESDSTTGKVVDADALAAALNKLLRGELSAVETHGQATLRLGASPLGPQLADCKRSHEQRVETLRHEILRLGGKPSEGSGLWGGFAKLVEGSAKLFGERAAIAALEEGEDHGLKLYREVLPKLDASSRDLVERTLLPEQERTHRIASTLRHSIH